MYIASVLLPASFGFVASLCYAAELHEAIRERIFDDVDVDTGARYWSSVDSRSMLMRGTC